MSKRFNQFIKTLAVFLLDHLDAEGSVGASYCRESFMKHFRFPRHYWGSPPNIKYDSAITRELHARRVDTSPYGEFI